MHFLNDLRLVLRSWLRSPGYALSATVTLALGIGVACAVLVTVGATLEQPLPFRDADRLVVVTTSLPGLGLPRAVLSPPFIQDLDDLEMSFESLMAYGRENMNFSGSSGDPQRLVVARVSAGATEVLGVDLHLGRDFLVEEDRHGGPRALILSHALWQQRFGGDPGVLGKSLMLDGVGHTVTGVLPPGLRFPVADGASADAWVPLAYKPKEQSRGYHDFTVVARLRPDLNPSQLSSEAEALKQAMMQANPGVYDYEWSFNIDPIQKEAVREIRGALLLLRAAVLFVLLIACFNVSNLLLARFSSRSRELSLRRALGRSSLASLRPVAAESSVVSLVGGLAGLLLALAMVQSFGRLAVTRLPQLVVPKADLSMVWVVAGLMALSAALVTLLPALWAGTRGSSTRFLVGGSRQGRSRRTGRILGSVMIAEIALALAMLVGAGLFVRSLDKLLDLDPGFQTESVAALRLSAPASRYEDMGQVHRFFGEILDEIRSVPGVELAGAVSALPLAGIVPTSSFQVEGLANDSDGRYPHTHFSYAMDGYFQAMGIQLLQGRTFRRQDVASSEPVVVVSESFARAFWPGQEAVGRRLSFVSDGGPEWRKVVGTVADVHLTTDSPEAQPIFYIPVAQRPFGMDSAFELSLVLRSPLPLQELLEPLVAAVARVDPALPFYDVRGMVDLLAQSISTRRLLRDVLAVFAAIAVILAAVGVYGVVAFVTGQRRHEFGVRMAVGARPGDVAESVLGQTLMASAAGLGLGLVLAWIASGFLHGLLYGVAPTDPATYLVTALFLALVALLAAVIPALWAARLDPVAALRTE